MSERMIELQRAKLGLPPAGQPASLPNISTSPKSSPNNPASTKKQTPAQAAVAAMYAEDSLMERFINRLQKRDDSNPAFLTGGDNIANTGESHGPTVPTALSRRMLQRQGVGYLDNTVAAVVSASADRFLATVLQQAVACRDQRLKGAAMAREAAKHRKRHIQHYKEDTDDRKRRKEMIESAREKVATTTINKAEALKKGGAAKAAVADQASAEGKTTATTTTTSSSSAAATASNSGSSKKKAKKPEEGPVNGTKLDPAIRKLADEEEEDYDSIDEEEEYYQELVGDDATGGHGLAGDNGDEDDEEDEDDTLILRDIVRPLEAWNFHLTGKEDLESHDEGDDDEDADDRNADVDDDEGSTTEVPTGQTPENGKDDDSTAVVNGTDGNKSDGDDNDTDGIKKSASS
ncbi:transcription initiation factor TFIID 23 subunit [Nitzschia inconspicua]|uniref:Transcription initiation factor TFIID 23 subunit n=1 Tax=Nitzschia inconspicua TaxID=303405 RepID=A0A9K3L9N1_9STRA|nr:transcription initiation factor TFIID 23 subunit [Nitzschia inconspicua]